MGTFISLILLLFTLCLFCGIGYYLKFEKRAFLYIAIWVAFTKDICLLTSSQSIFDMLIAMSFAVSIAANLLLLTSLIKSKVITFWVDIILTLLVLTPIVVTRSLGIIWISNDVWLTIWQTNLSEACIFFLHSLCWKSVLAYLLLLTVVILCNIKRQVLPNIGMGRIVLCIVTLATISLCSYYCISGVKCATSVLEAYARKTEYLKRNINADYSGFSRINKDTVTCVVIVGESLCRDYMSAYGYPIKTTPQIDKLLKDSALLKIEHAYSPDIYTVVCVPRMLTSESLFCNNMDYVSIDLFKKNGFKCSWISNQVNGGLDDTGISILADRADKKIFAKNFDGYDESLFPYIRKALEEKVPRKFLVIHLIGNHEPASTRYPHKKPFLRDVKYNNDTIYHYENSVIYNDYIVSEIIKMLPTRNAYCFYASDHGQEPGRPRLTEQFCYKNVRIPFLVYFSPDLRKKEIYQQIKRHQECYWTNDLLFNLICGVMGVKNPDVLEERYNLSSASYSLDRSDIAVCKGRFKIENDK